MTPQEQCEPTTFMYCFSVWPDEALDFDKAIYLLFEAMGTRTELQYTEAEFNTFRAGLAKHGLTLREIERVPYVDPETVL